MPENLNNENDAPSDVGSEGDVTSAELMDLEAECLSRYADLGGHAYAWQDLEKKLRACDADVAGEFAMDLSIRTSARLVTLTTLKVEALVSSHHRTQGEVDDGTFMRAHSQHLAEMINALASLQTHHFGLLEKRARITRSAVLKKRGQAALKLIDLPQSGGSKCASA